MKVTDSDARYAGYWKPFIYFIVTIGLALLIGLSLQSELRDLQRRVGQLENERQ